MFWKSKKPAPQTKFAEIRNDLNPDLELCYTDQRGNKYYRYKNPAKIAASRYLKGWESIEWANMGVSAKEAVEYVDNAIKAVNDHNYSQVAYNLINFKNRVVKSNPEWAYLEIASVYILMNAENPKVYDTAFAKIKINIWSEDADARAFFLSHAFETSKHLTDTLSEITLNASLETMKGMMAMVQSTLSKLSAKDSPVLTSSTGQSRKGI